MLEPSRPVTAADITQMLTEIIGGQLPLIPDTELPAIPAVDLNGERVMCDCGHCGDIHPVDDMIRSENQELCPDCVRVCESCERVGTKDDGFAIAREDNGRRAIRNERCRCNRCSVICADCDVRFHSLENQNSDGALICGFCAENYYTCDGCTAVIYAESSRGDENGEQNFCRSCHEAREADTAEDHESEPTPGHLIYEHDYKPRPTYLLGEGEKQSANSIYLGIELETECKGAYSNKDCIKTTGLNVNPVFYMKRDGSLNNGMEIVSHPATFKYWMNADLNFCNKLIELGCRSYDTKTAGMHVHISKSALTTAQQAKLLMFVKNNESFMLFISRRANKSAMARWAGIDNGRAKDLIERVRDPHGYHAYRYTQRYNQPLPDNYNTLFGRYCAINLFNAKTIEFRIFRGTLDINSIKRNLAFVVVLTAYMRDCGVAKYADSDDPYDRHEYGLDYHSFHRWIWNRGWVHIGGKMAMVLSRWIDKFNPRRTANPLVQIEHENSIGVV